VAARNSELLKPATPRKICRLLVQRADRRVREAARGAARVGLEPDLTSAWGFGTGSQRSIKASSRVKMAVLAPMPSASGQDGRRR
jgi:hypothetical protein